MNARFIVLDFEPPDGRLGAKSVLGEEAMAWPDIAVRWLLLWFFCRIDSVMTESRIWYGTSATLSWSSDVPGAEGKPDL